MDSIGTPRVLSTGHIAICIGLVKRGWAQVCAEGICVVGDNEPRMAGYLFLAMHDLPEDLPFLVVNEGAERGHLHSVVPTGFIDFKFHYGLGADDFIGMECKRVSGASRDRKLADEYIREGVERYSAAKYCVGHEFGLMLGFVVDGTEKSTRAMLRAALLKRRKESSMRGSWIDSTLFDRHWHNGPVSQTTHVQIATNVRMKILHFFAEFP